MRARRFALAAGVFLAGLAALYRIALASDFGLLSGEPFDTRIQIALLEHWWRVLRLEADPLSPNFFHPTPGALAYNDAYLLSGLVYAGFRALRVDPFLAYEGVNVSLRAIGFVATFSFARRFLRVPFGWALFTAALFLVSTNLVSRMNHAQLLYANLVPLGLLLVYGVKARLALAPERPVLPGLALLMALVALWSLSAFYAAYFFALFTLVVLAVDLALLRGPSLDVVRRFLRRPWRAAVLPVLLALPVLAVAGVYGAAYRETGGHEWSVTRDFLPTPIDLVNVGPSNLVWSGPVGRLYEEVRGVKLTVSELTTGYTPLVLACFLLGLARVRTAGSAGGSAAELLRPNAVVLGLGASTALMLLLILKVGERSLWEAAWFALPGARAVRIPTRFVLFLTPVVCLVVGYTLARLSAAASPGRRRLVLVGAALLLLEQWHLAPPFELDRRFERALLRYVPPPPAACRAFYVARPRLSASGNAAVDVFYNHSVDAMILAAVKGLPTVNGVASFLPPGWDLHSPFAPDYAARVRAYAARQGLAPEGLCGLDLLAYAWTGPIGP